MFRRWVALAFGCLAAACGERAGDPIVGTRPSADAARGPGAEGGASGAEVGGASGAPSEGGEGNIGPGPAGLCSPCGSSTACGDPDDACIRHREATFCGRDCDEGDGCPDGYVCVNLDNTRLQQCVPLTGCPGPVTPAPSLEEVRQILLARINTERLARDRDLLTASECLNDLAQASAVAYADSDEPLAKYIDECDPIWPSCSCGWTAEAEVAVAEYGLDWSQAIERALADTGFTSSYLNFDFAAVGVGFWLSGDEAWIALSFH